MSDVMRLYRFVRDCPPLSRAGRFRIIATMRPIKTSRQYIAEYEANRPDK